MSLSKEIVCCQLQTPCFSENKNTKKLIQNSRAESLCLLLHPRVSRSLCVCVDVSVCMCVCVCVCVREREIDRETDRGQEIDCARTRNASLTIVFRVPCIRADKIYRVPCIRADKLCILAHSVDDGRRPLPLLTHAVDEGITDALDCDTQSLCDDAVET